MESDGFTRDSIGLVVESLNPGFGLELPLHEVQASKHTKMESDGFTRDSDGFTTDSIGLVVESLNPGFALKLLHILSDLHLHEIEAGQSVLLGVVASNYNGQNMAISNNNNNLNSKTKLSYT